MDSDAEAQALRDNVAAHVRAAMLADSRIEKQATLARAAHVSQSSISRICNAQTGVTLETLAAVAKACGVMAYRLLLPPTNVPNPPGQSPGGQLMDRLTTVSKKHALRGQHEAPNPRTTGRHPDSQKPTPRKKRRSPAAGD